MDPSHGLRELVDSDLDPDEVLLRIVQPTFVNRAISPPVPQSNAFQDQSLSVANSFGLASPCASLAVKSLWLQSGAGVEGLLRGFPPESGVLEFTVRAARELETLGGQPCPQGVMLDPRDEAPWHAVMWDLSGTSASKGVKRARLTIAQWFKVPE